MRFGYIYLLKVTNINWLYIIRNEWQSLNYIQPNRYKNIDLAEYKIVAVYRFYELFLEKCFYGFEFTTQITFRYE